MNENRTVTVRAKHQVGRRPYVVWVEPVGWKPRVDQIEETIFWSEGAAWEGDQEVAGIAATYMDLGVDKPEEGEEYEVKLAALFWLTSGDCRNIGDVEVASC